MGKKLTIDFVRSSFKEEGYAILDTVYINGNTKLRYTCPMGHQHSITWCNWKRGKRCPYCAGNNKHTVEFIKEQFKKEGYVVLDTAYKNANTKLKYICPNGHKHSIRWGDWYKGSRCPFCAGKAKPTIEDVKASFEKAGYILLSTQYINNNSKLKYICSNGHNSAINWNNWLQGKRCIYCSKKAPVIYDKIKKSFEQEGYKLLSKRYVKSHCKLHYICPEGHKHSMSWNNWRKKHRCPSCYKINSAGIGSPHWKGGVVKRNTPLYDTYNKRLSYCEETRREPKDPTLLQVRCTKCREWFTPTTSGVKDRINVLEKLSGNTAKESRFYCSEGCKQSCTIFGMRTQSVLKNDLSYNHKELQIWSQEVLKRENNICEYCGAPAKHAHHIQPKKLEPFLALDPDNGVACCKECHYKYGHSGECSTGMLSIVIC